MVMSYEVNGGYQNNRDHSWRNEVDASVVDLAEKGADLNRR